ncbi:MAG TPA: response regulator [Alphaproteobacteria bacterium]|nr:response regulator [Alphaproteobacteria bacterium]
MRKALRIVVVEDDAVIGILLAELLAGMGHDVCAIETTEAGAVTAAAQYDPDMMIVDVGLGAGSGISAVEKILRSRPVPHVFVSGNVARSQMLSPGAVFIEKPYRESDLVRGILKALSKAATF